MIISEKYGPQYDPADGTIGKIQLVKRWVVQEDDELFSAKQGRFTYETKEDCDKRISLIVSANPNMKFDKLEGQEWWCYPNHFDPAYPVRNVEEVMRDILQDIVVTLDLNSMTKEEYQKVKNSLKKISIESIETNTYLAERPNDDLTEKELDFVRQLD